MSGKNKEWKYARAGRAGGCGRPRRRPDVARTSLGHVAPSGRSPRKASTREVLRGDTRTALLNGSSHQQTVHVGETAPHHPRSLSTVTPTSRIAGGARAGAARTTGAFYFRLRSSTFLNHTARSQNATLPPRNPRAPRGHSFVGIQGYASVPPISLFFFSLPSGRFSTTPKRTFARELVAARFPERTAE